MRRTRLAYLVFSTLVALGVAAPNALAAGHAAASATPVVQATTGQARLIGVNTATLEGTIGPLGSPPAGSTARVYFQLGTKLPYELQSVDQGFVIGAPQTVHVSLTGLQSDKLYHYRLVAVDNDSRISIGADRTFMTAPEGRLRPSALHLSVTPRFHFLLPDVVKVSGAVVPPLSLGAAKACKGFVDVVFRVHKVAIQTLRAGLHRDCSFQLKVRFSNRRRLHGGHVVVHVLFPGNRYMQRLAATPQEIQIG